MEYNPEAIALLKELGEKIEALVTDEHYDACASFWPQSMSLEEVVGFALACAEYGNPMGRDDEE